MDEAVRVRLPGEGNQRRQECNRFLAIEPPRPDAIENRKALPEFGQHCRAAGRVEAGRDRTSDVFNPPGVELGLKLMKSSKEPRCGRSAPGFQAQEPGGRAFTFYQK